MKYKVYKLIDPNTLEVRYVGITTGSLLKRLAGHINQIYRKEKFSGKGDWIEELISKGQCPLIELIEEVDSSEKKRKERYWVQYYKQNNSLFNVQYNDSENLARSLSERKSVKIYEYNIDGEFVKEWRSITDAAMFYKIEHKNICAAANGKRKLCGGKMWRYFKAEKIPNYFKDKFRKEVHQYDLNGNYLKSYPSARDVEGFKYKVISKVCLEKANTYKGYRFSFEKLEKLPPLIRRRVPLSLENERKIA